MPVVPDITCLREPNLLIPGKKPIGPVEYVGPKIDSFVLFDSNDISGTVDVPVKCRQFGFNQAYKSVLVDRVYNSGLEPSPWGLHFTGGPSGAHNNTHVAYSGTAAASMPKTWLATGVDIWLTDWNAYEPTLLTTGSYNEIGFTSSTSFIIRIGNTAVTLAVSSMTKFEGEHVRVVVLMDQTGATRNSYVWINGKQYQILGTTKDTYHDQSGGLYFNQNARVDGGSYFILKSQWFSIRQNLSLDTLRSLSIDPYQFFKIAGT